MFLRFPSGGPARSTLLAGLLSFCAWVLGAAPAPAPAADILRLARPAVRSYGQRDGLPDHTLHGISRDALGRVWVATQQGAAVYDGGRWTPFLLPQESPSQFIRQVFPDRDGSFWFATQEAGIWHLTGTVWEHQGAAQGLPSERVHQLLRVEGAQPGLWAASAEGPCRLENGVWVVHAQGLGTPFTWRLVTSPGPGGQSRLWACTRGGLASWTGAGWRLEPELQGMEVNDFMERTGPGGTPERWASVWAKGLSHWQGDGWSLLPAGPGTPGRFPTCLAVSRDARGAESLWVGTYDRGLARLDGDGWQLYTSDRGMRSHAIYCLLPEPSGQPTLWIGMLGGGITALSLEGWSFLPLRRLGLDSSEVTGMLETRTGPETRLWFATESGVVWWDGGAWQVENGRNGLPARGLKRLAALPGGNGPELFLGTDTGLLRRTRDGRWTPVPGLPREPVHALLAATGSQGPRLWIGSPAGLFLFEQGRVTAIGGLPGQPDIRSLAETPDGSLWVGTRGAGILRGRQGLWTRSDPIPRFQAINLFTCLHVSRGERGQPLLWAASRGNGLARLDLADPAGAWTIYDGTGAVPLPSTVILGLLEDDQGRFFLSTSGGINRLTFAGDRRTLLATETYTSADGVNGTLSVSGAGMVDSRRRVWVGALDGAVFLDPALVPGTLPLPAPVVQRAEFPGGHGALPADGRLRHWQNRLEVNFFLPVFHREEDQRFRTQLLGLEAQPGPWRFERSRDYVGLRPGAYTLLIWARDPGGRISPPAALAFRILPAPWAHPLALGGYLLLLGGALLAFLRLRTRALRRRNQWLSEQVDLALGEVRAREAELGLLNTELRYLNEEKNLFLGIAAHDLKSPLQGILLSAERLTGLDEATAQAVGSRIQRAAQLMVRLIDGLLNVSAIEAGTRAPLQPLELQPILEAARERAAEGAQAKGLELLLEPLAEGLQARTHAQLLGEVLDNLISNAVKFMPPGPPGRIRIRAQAGAEGVAVQIEDQGPGFTEQDKALAFKRFQRLSAQPTAGESSTGLGLSIVRKLVERLEGRIQLDSEPGQGARFTLTLPS
jgi:signal transduction histidine kinase/ligand-binding sensor domain-containing protein